MWVLPVLIVVTLASVALRRSRWATVSLRISRAAYALFVVYGLLYFPLKSGGYRAQGLSCEWTFDLALAIHSLTNVKHIVLLGIFFLLTYAQLPNVRHAMLWSMAACIAMGLLVELSQGATGHGHCRMRDLIPDTAGTLAGALVVAAVKKLRALGPTGRSG